MKNTRELAPAATLSRSRNSKRVIGLKRIRLKPNRRGGRGRSPPPKLVSRNAVRASERFPGAPPESGL